MTSVTPRFLVIGGSGLIGCRFLRTVGPQRALGTYSQNPFPGGVPFDLATGQIAEVIDQSPQGFTHALILGGVTNIDRCAKDPIGTAAINVEGMIRTIDAILERAIVPIFASSDAIYDGSHGNWCEDDPAEPIIVYGRQKRAVEQHLSSQSRPFVILRIAKVLDAELAHTGILGPWIADLIHGKLIRCATDQRFCPLGTDDVVDAILKLVAAGATGIFNLGGAQVVSRIDLLEMTKTAVSRYRTMQPVIERCSLRDLPFLEPRPLDLTMSIAKLRAAISFEPEQLETLCHRAAMTALDR